MNSQEIELLKSGKHLIVELDNGKEIEIGMHVASLGVRFVCVYKNGRRMRNTRKAQASVIFGGWTCTDWLGRMKLVMVVG